MLKKLGLPALLLATALTLLGPTAALAERHGREHEHHHGRFGVYFGYGPSHGAYGYYDRWGYWHPYGPYPYGYPPY
jgi:hypothetical protein